MVGEKSFNDSELDRIDDVIEEITTDAYSEEEQMWAFCNAFEENITLPVDTFVIGEPVTIQRFEFGGNMRLGLRALCRKPDGSEYQVSAVDLSFEGYSEAARYLAAYRKWVGLDPSMAVISQRKHHKASADDLDLSRLIDLVVLSVKDRAVRCSIPGTMRIITLRAKSFWNAAPGEILTIHPNKQWKFSGHPYLSGKIESRRIDISALNLTPLKLAESGMWDPGDECRDEQNEPFPGWIESVINHGRRSKFEMEQIVLSDPDSGYGDPLILIDEYIEDGYIGEAQSILMRLAEADLRCLNVHYYLGNMAFKHWCKDAKRHYEIGMRIGDLSIPEDFEAVLLWDQPGNQPYLNCIKRYGLCLWRLEMLDEAEKIFKHMLWLDPTDGSDSQFLLEHIMNGIPWESIYQENQIDR